MKNNKIKEIEAKAVGRPSKYDTNIKPYLDTIRMLRQEGQTEEAIAKRFNVVSSTWYTYKLKFPEFAEALKEEMDFVQAKTEKSLYNTAWGWREPQVKETYERNSRTGEMILTKKEILPDKVIVGNVLAQKLILTNIASGKWQDRRVNETTVTSNVEELKAIAETLNSLGQKGIDKSQFDCDEEVISGSTEDDE